MADGALLLDKPVGLTSNRALQQARKLFGVSKAGHAGTLDPLASGLLLVLFGEGTKFAGPHLDDDKEYLATLKLGEKTSTGDAEGEVIETREHAVSESELGSTLQKFLGELEQVPPMHSALKRDGVPLYRLARAGETVERAARRVRISELENIAFTPPYLRLRVRCSKGTYVRTLAEDIGAALGSCAHLTALRRIGSGRWRVEDAVTLDALSSMSPALRAQHLLPLTVLLGGFPRVELDADQDARFRNGQTLKAFSPAAGPAAPGALLAVYGPDGRVIGLGEAQADGAVRPVRLVSSRRSSQAADNHRKTL